MREGWEGSGFTKKSDRQGCGDIRGLVHRSPLEKKERETALKAAKERSAWRTDLGGRRLWRFHESCERGARKHIMG